MGAGELLGQLGKTNCEGLPAMDRQGSIEILLLNCYATCFLNETLVCNHSNSSSLTVCSVVLFFIDSMEVDLTAK